MNHEPDAQTEPNLLHRDQRDIYAGAKNHLDRLQDASANEDLQVEAGVRAPRTRSSPLALALTLLVLAAVAAFIIYRILAP